jgi:hypothetical protein
MFGDNISSVYLHESFFPALLPTVAFEIDLHGKKDSRRIESEHIDDDDAASLPSTTPQMRSMGISDRWLREV